MPLAHRSFATLCMTLATVFLIACGSDDSGPDATPTAPENFDFESSALALFAENTGTESFDLAIDLRENELRYCFREAGCLRSGTFTLHSIGQDERGMVSVSTESFAEEGDPVVGMVAEYEIQQGEGQIEIATGNIVDHNGDLFFEEDEIVFTSALFSAGETAFIEVGYTER